MKYANGAAASAASMQVPISISRLRIFGPARMTAPQRTFPGIHIPTSPRGLIGSGSKDGSLSRRRRNAAERL